MPEPRAGRRLWVVAVIAAAVIAVALGAAGVSAWSSGRSATASLDRATELIQSADESVVRIDEVVRSDVTSALAAPAREAAADVEEAASQLKQAIAVIEDAEADLPQADRERATLLLQAARARLDMLAQAPAILSANEGAAVALPLAQSAWASLLTADGLSDRAVVQYNKLTKSAVQASSRLNKEAASELASAQAGFQAAEQAFPQAEFETYLAYLSTRVALNGYSQRSDAAWLRGDVEAANREITEYNALDAKGIAQAKALPESPASAVASAYEAAATASTEEYYAARDRATKVDARLRGL